MVLKWIRTKPEPLKYFEQELNLNPNRYLKRFDTLIAGGTRPPSRISVPYRELASTHQDSSVPTSRFRASPHQKKTSWILNEEVTGSFKKPEIHAEASAKLWQRSFFLSSSKFMGKIRTKGRRHWIWSKIFTRLMPYSECIWPRLRKRPPHAIFHSLNTSFCDWFNPNLNLTPTLTLIITLTPSQNSITRAHPRRIKKHVKFETRLLSTRGVFRGGPLGHGPPFGSLGLQNCIVKWAKLRHGPPFVSLASGFWLEIWVSSGEKRDGPWVKTFFFFCSSPKFGQKMGRNLSEDLFFLCSSPKFGRKMRLNLSGTTSDSDLCSSQIFWNFWPPPFQNPAYATAFYFHYLEIELILATFLLLL